MGVRCEAMNTVGSTCHDDVNTRRPVGNERGHDTAPYSAISPGKNWTQSSVPAAQRSSEKRGGRGCMYKRQNEGLIVIDLTLNVPYVTCRHVGAFAVSHRKWQANSMNPAGLILRCWHGGHTLEEKTNSNEVMWHLNENFPLKANFRLYHLAND